jgi:hypothetical protein
MKSGTQLLPAVGMSGCGDLQSQETAAVASHEDSPCLLSPSCTALVPYSLSSPFHDSLKVQDRFFPFFQRTLHLEQDWKPDGTGGTSLGYGASVYNSSIVLASFIESMATAEAEEAKVDRDGSRRTTEVFVDKIAIEIGCGPALVSIVASMAGMKAVLATDGDTTSVQLAARNIAKNCEGLSIRSQQLLWGNSDHIQSALETLTDFPPLSERTRLKPDYIFASDVSSALLTFVSLTLSLFLSLSLSLFYSPRLSHVSSGGSLSLRRELSKFNPNLCRSL